MKPDTLLLRQIHPNFVQQGRVTSQAFRPTPKDENLLSVDDGDRISAAKAFARFTAAPNCRSAGVMAVAQAECAALELPVIGDGKPYPEHCSIDFAGCSPNERDRKAKRLAHGAQERGWQFQP